MKPGRPSASSLSVVQIGDRIGRPPPPAELTPEQAEEWRGILEALPADWVSREQFPILSAFCRHTCHARFLAGRMQEMMPLENWAEFAQQDKLAGALERETRAMLASARALRLTQQSRYDPAKAARRAQGNPKGKPPWET